jgi:2-(1,2-epoxy-1,2-dihydrophenyl)acetyl-CoA isomerase
MENEPLLVHREGPVVTLTLNRPEKLNALNEEMPERLRSALATAGHDPSVRAAVITGAGQAFCSGGDIDTMIDLKENHHSANFRQYLEGGHELVRQIRRLPKIVLASLNGPAIGAGMNLALACDLRIASDGASFAQEFVRLGLHPDWGGTFLLPRLIGMGRAMEMFTLGETVSVADAHRFGLVNFVVASDRLAAETASLALRLAEVPPIPVALLKQALYERLDTELDMMMEHEVHAQMKCFDSEDFREGLHAFREKRRPKFKGI